MGAATTATTATSGQASAAASTRRRRTRERLIVAAFGVFAEHGAAATVEQICEAAGFTRGAFYSNYDSKEQLFLAVLQRFYDELLKSARRRAAGEVPVELRAEPTIDTLGALVFDTVRSVSDDRDWQLIQSEATRLALRDPSFGASYLALRQRALTELADLLELGTERIGRRLLIDREQAIRVLFAVHEGLLTDLLVERRPLAELPGLIQEPIAAVLLGITEPIPERTP